MDKFQHYNDLCNALLTCQLMYHREKVKDKNKMNTMLYSKTVSVLTNRIAETPL